MHEAAVFDKPKTNKERTNKSSLKLYGNFLNKIANNETNINTEIFN